MQLIGVKTGPMNAENDEYNADSNLFSYLLFRSSVLTALKIVSRELLCVKKRERKKKKSLMI